MDEWEEKKEIKMTEIDEIKSNNGSNEKEKYCKKKLQWKWIRENEKWKGRVRKNRIKGWKRKYFADGKERWVRGRGRKNNREE